MMHPKPGVCCEWPLFREDSRSPTRPTARMRWRASALRSGRDPAGFEDAGDRRAGDVPANSRPFRGADHDRIRQAKHRTEKVEALESGADDYVTKPLGIDELVARIHAVTRRPSVGRHLRVVRLESVEIDLESHEVKRGQNTDHLTSKEFRLLYYFLQNAGKVVSHRRLLQAVWGPDYGNEVEYLRVFINQLRKKIEPDPSHPKYISPNLLPATASRQAKALGKSIVPLFCLCNPLVF